MTRILLVEDEAIIALDLKCRLERLDYQVVGIADSGAEAIAMATATQPTLVFMDIIIQGPMDGIATAAELGRMIDVPIVFLTAHSDTATIQRARQVRPYGYLIKPFEERELQTTIEMALYRHQSEAKARLLQTAMSSATLAMAVADARDPEGRFILGNPAFVRLTGYSAAELREQTPRFLEGPDTDPSTSAEIHRALAEGRDHRATFIAHRKDGTPFWDDLTVSIVRNPVGEVTHFLFFHDDITARKQMESALLQAQKMEAVGQLTCGIAHDFNNILAVILSFAGFVRDDLPEGDPRREDIVEVLRAADKAASLTRQLLTFSRQQPSATRPIDLNACVANLLKMLRRSVGESVDIEIAPSARPAVVRMDPVQFDQVILNLAVNARDAMGDGGRLRFAISHPAETVGEFAAGRCVRVTATDTGEGMSRATMTRIFDPFFTTKPVGKGTGLGLATCFAIVRGAGGTIAVESSVGKGTTFTIDLPICDEPIDDDAESISPDIHGAGERVLVVEDDAPLRKAAVRILEGAGYQVLQAEDGDKAVALLEDAAGVFDLIVSDVVMPGCGGYSLLEYVKEHSPRTRVLLTSGYLDGRAGVGADLDAAPLLWKPYSRVSLLRAARAALGMASADHAPKFQPSSPAAGPRGHGVALLFEEGAAPTDAWSTGPAAGTPATNGEPTAAPTARSVLLVDDDEGQRDAYGRALRAAGFTVSVAHSAKEAMGFLDAQSFHGVVTDIVLPGADGMAVLRAARAKDPDVPVLLVTGAPSVETATMVFHNRAIGYLAKPFLLEHLVREVERAVEAGEVLKLQRKLFAARAGAEEFLLDVAATRSSFEAALRALQIAFQPIVRSHGGSIFGYEALLRSSEPTLSTPLKVLAAAEALGRMDEVGLAVRRAIADTLAKHPAHTEAIFVNLHPSELRTSLLCAAAEPLLRSAGRIVLEVIERTSLSMGHELTEEVRLLRAAGYRVAIDDLGEGYAGLSWLAHLRPDIAKIDMSLVRDVHRSPLKREIVGSLIGVCRRAGITALAEGVETADEAQLLTDLGCDLLQGYFFAKPGPAFPEVRGAPRRAEDI